MEQGAAADCSGVPEGQIKCEPEDEHSYSSIYASENINEKLIKAEMNSEDTPIKEELDIGPTVLQRHFLPGSGLLGPDVREVVDAIDWSSGEQKSECNEEAGHVSEQRNKLKTRYFGNEQHPDCNPSYLTLKASTPDVHFTDLARYKHKKPCHSNYLIVLRHTGEKPLGGDRYDPKFKQSSELIMHKSAHTGEKTFPCYLCDKKFRQSSGLSRHKRIHTGEKSYSCDLCNEKFWYSNSLISHQRMHTGEKPFKCEFCDTKFRMANDLSRHRRIHTGEKPYYCDLCGAKFRVSNDLSRHKRLHTGE